MSVTHTSFTVYLIQTQIERQAGRNRLQFTVYSMAKSGVNVCSQAAAHLIALPELIDDQ